MLNQRAGPFNHKNLIIRVPVLMLRDITWAYNGSRSSPFGEKVVREIVYGEGVL